MNNLFSEKQRFKQIWIWALLIIVDVFAIYEYIHQVQLNPITNNQMNNRHLPVLLILLLLITLFFVFIRLDTEIKEDGIYYRFYPFIKLRKIAWDELEKCYVRKYKPLREYGGWGMRIGVMSGKRAYNISGNMGLQLNFKTGKNLLIGTQKPDELEKVLRETGKMLTV